MNSKFEILKKRISSYRLAVLRPTGLVDCWADGMSWHGFDQSVKPIKPVDLSHQSNQSNQSNKFDRKGLGDSKPVLLSRYRSIQTGLIGFSGLTGWFWRETVSKSRCPDAETSDCWMNENCLIFQV